MNTHQHQHQYAYAAASDTMAYAAPSAPQYAGQGNASASAPRQYAGQGTSSAFSASALPGEDWTKIGDLAERRRIQNRIAQRNYRKKIKQKVAGLEEFVAKASGKELSSKAQPAKSIKKSSKPKGRQPTQFTTTTTITPQQNQFTPPMHPEDMFPSHYDDRPLFNTNYQYGSGEDTMLAPFGNTQHYRPVTNEPYPDYLLSSGPPPPPTLPSLSHFSDACSIRREGSFAGDESMPYMFGSMQGTAGPSHYGSNPDTPPALSHSFEHSANCSDAGYNYPTTPLSMPESPDMSD